MGKSFRIVVVMFVALAVSLSAESNSYAAASRVCTIEVRGAGYLQVLLPSGAPAYAKKGTVKIDKQNQLRLQGYVLSPGVTVPEDAANVRITGKGVVSASSDDNSDSIVLGTLTIVRFPNQKNLILIGKDLFRGSGDSGLPIVGAPGEMGYGQVSCKR